MSFKGSEEALARFLNEVVLGEVVRERVDQFRSLVAASRDGLEPRQKNTLELGGWVMLAGLAFGLQVGGWPVWSVVAAAVGYVAWVLAYSEATVQATRRQRLHRPLAIAD